MEYVEREAVLALLKDDREVCADSKEELKYIRADIRSIPAADVRPVVRGQWEEDCAGAAVCSVCGEYAFETSTHHLCGWFPNYCPNCGAMMEKS